MNFRLIRLKDSLNPFNKEDLDKRFREVLSTISSYVYSEYLPCSIEEAFIVLDTTGYYYCNSVNNNELSADINSELWDLFQVLYISNIMYSLLKIGICPVCRKDNILLKNNLDFISCSSCCTNFSLSSNCCIC